MRNKVILFCSLLIASCGEDETTPKTFFISGSATENGHGAESVTKT